MPSFFFSPLMNWGDGNFLSPRGIASLQYYRKFFVRKALMNHAIKCETVGRWNNLL